jgi:hypothetical protein
MLKKKGEGERNLHSISASGGQVQTLEKGVADFPGIGKSNRPTQHLFSSRKLIT